MMWSWASILAIVVDEDAETLPQFAKKAPQGGVDYSYLAYTRRVFAIVTAPFWKLGPWYKIPYSSCSSEFRHSHCHFMGTSVLRCPPIFWQDHLFLWTCTARAPLDVQKVLGPYPCKIQQGKKPNGSSRSKHSCWIPTSKTDFSSNPPKKKACVAFLGCENTDDRPRNQSIYSQEIVKFDNGPGPGSGAPGATVLVKPGDVAGGSGSRAGSMEVFCGGQWGYP